MKIEVLNINDLIPYEMNAKLHPREQIEQIKQSIIEFNNNDPIAIDENNVVIEGHGRLKALTELGYEQVECIRLSHLNDDQKKAYRLVHNKLTMNSDFDMGMLEEEINKIKDINLFEFGFDLFEEVEQKEEKEEKPEIEFTSSLEEEHNYIVLYFDNDIDWLQAQSLFDIKTVKELSTRKDGTITNERKGIGRVLNGAKALTKLTEGYFNEDKH